MTLRAKLLRSTCFALGLLVPLSLAGCGSLGDFILAPVRVGGHVEVEAFTEGSSEEERRSGERTELFVDANSFIWQPWFITVDGDVSITQEIQTGDFDTSSTFWSGGSTLNVLPLSNYPSAFSYRHSDSRSSGSISGRDKISDSVSLRARQILGDDLRTGFRTFYEVIDEFEFGEEERFFASFDGSKTFDSSTLSLALDYQNQDFQSNIEEDESEELFAGSLNFAAKPFQDTYSDSTLTIVDETEVEGSEMETTFLAQGVSSINWQPYGEAYSINGALRLFSEDTTNEDESPLVPTQNSEELTASGVLGINYIVSPRFVTHAGISATYEESSFSTDDPLAPLVEETREEIEGSVFGGASYRSETMDIRGFDWNWFSTGDARVTQDSEEGLENEAALTLGHDFDKVFTEYIAAPLRMSISQSGTLQHSTEEGLVPILDHRLSFTHSSVTNGAPIYGRLSLSDRRELAGDDEREFQLIDFQLNRQERLDAYSSWSAGFGAQFAREKTNQDGEAISLSANGSLGYFAANVFDVQRLTFSSQLDVAALGLEDVFDDENNDFDEDDDELRSEWRNILEYRIGRVVMSLEGTVAYEDEEFRDLVLFRIRREFDAVF